MITYPEGLYHAHYTVGLPGTAVLFARGALVVILDVFLLLGVWAVGRWVILGHVIRPAESWLGVASFQGACNRGPFRVLPGTSPRVSRRSLRAPSTARLCARRRL